MRCSFVSFAHVFFSSSFAFFSRLVVSQLLIWYSPKQLSSPVFRFPNFHFKIKWKEYSCSRFVGCSVFVVNILYIRIQKWLISKNKRHHSYNSVFRIIYLNILRDSDLSEARNWIHLFIRIAKCSCPLTLNWQMKMMERNGLL